MKKSELRKLIRECVEEILTEASLNRDVDNFLSQIPAEKVKNAFANYVVPFLRKSTENPTEKLAYISALRNAILDPSKAPTWLVNQMEQAGLSLQDKNVRVELSRLVPILANFQKFIEAHK